jgi:lysophospholipase L1-like esterase
VTSTAVGRSASDLLTRETNREIQAASVAVGATYVDLYQPFRGASGSDDPTALLADDGDHPDARGHQVIADALLAAGLRPLRLPR